MGIQFHYHQRPDILVNYRPRFQLRTAYRCHRIRVFERTNTVRIYDLGYASTSNTQPLSLLKSIKVIGADESTELPPAQFDYTLFDGKSSHIVLSTFAPSIDFNDGNIDLLDINGDALPDILDTTTNPHGHYMNLGPLPNGEIEWAEYSLMNTSIQLHLAAGTSALADIDGNSRTDLLNLFSSKVELFIIDEKMEWKREQDIANATFSLFDPDVRLLDANGDRLIDVMMTTGGLNTVWVCLNAKKWSDPFTIESPAPWMKFSQLQTRTADMNGDRLLDLVYIANQAWYYFPNMGYGKFGDQVEMSRAPDQIIDERRLLLADMNGDG